jgi:hypothetical protein
MKWTPNFGPGVNVVRGACSNEKEQTNEDDMCTKFRKTKVEGPCATEVPPAGSTSVSYSSCRLRVFLPAASSSR